MIAHKKLKNYLILGGLTLIFIGPLAAAVVLYNKHPAWLTDKTLNKGQLLSPPLDFNTLKKQILFKSNRQHRWQIVYLTKTNCAQVCQQQLNQLEQVILALGKNSDQVSAILIQIELSSEIKNKNISHYSITTHEYQHFFSAKKLATGYYIVDPLGKIMLYYPASTPSEHLYKDLTHLL
jgi:hypothetical protein